MTVCNVCGQVKGNSNSCIKLALQLNGHDHEPIPWGKGKGESGDKCPGCGVAQQGYHHPGCERELCPCCGRSIITCHCEQT